MDYTKEITIPKNTPESQALKIKLKVPKGVVHKVSISFPYGVAGLARVQIFRASTQVWPTTNGEYYTGNGVTIEFNEYYEVKEEPLYFTIKAWNLDDTYDHTITVRIFMLEEDKINTLRKLDEISSLLKRFVEAIGA